MFVENTPIIVFEITAEYIIIGNPEKGLQRLSLSEFQASLEDDVRFAVPRRIGSTPTSKFGWNWFTPLLASTVSH